MSSLVKVSAVSYLNTIPFIYGLNNSEIKSHISLSLDYPSECARRVTEGEVDIGLVPVYSIINKPDFRIVGDFCIGANGNVRTVSLLSNSHLNDIKTVYLDYQSQTSIALIKVLAKHFWNISLKWQTFSPNQSFKDILPHEGVLAIGDKVFEQEKNFKYNIDLANEWKIFTAFPMVFAVWATSKQLNIEFEKMFNLALNFGCKNIEKAIDLLSNGLLTRDEAFDYLTNNISYNLDKNKKEGLKLFNKLVNETII